MSALNPTPPQMLADARGRPYFLWDLDLTIEAFRDRLRDPDLDVRSYFVAKLMRQAKPDDVFTFVSAREIRELWPRLVPILGQTREFWTWLFETWERQGHVWR
jgi:hypothetical protein